MNKKRESFKNNLLELLEEDETIRKGTLYEVIYEIDDIIIYGGFEAGYRGIDHNILKCDGVSWYDIIKWGIVVVPETTSYISNEPIEKYEYIGYKNLPLDNNHIMGYK